MPRRRKEEAVEGYHAEIVVTEEGIREAVSKMLCDRGYLVVATDIELEDCDTLHTVVVRCTTRLPKSVIPAPPESRDS